MNPQAKSCYATIATAIAAASPNDTIQVAAGIYHEGIVIRMPLSLVGASREITVIDATGQPNGIYIDGIDSPGLANVQVAGFTIQNANFEGILVTNASSITISNVHVTGNDKNLDVSSVTCPGIYPFETAEGFDCGEGIHLSGVSHSIVDHSIVENNAGGILLSDDTGATHDNLISRNIVRFNPFDCGITLASHPPAALTGSATPLGVYRNTISGNQSYKNGLAVGEGAGVGIFDSVPGTANYANVVVGNDLTDNGLPGVTMHSHTPGQNITDNMIIGNHIARNGKDADDSATPGTTGINVFGVSPASGTIISQNVIEQQDDDIVVNTPAQIDIHLNSLMGTKVGVANIGPGSANATLNWWKCAGGPEANGCTSVSGNNILFSPWLTKPPQAAVVQTDATE